MSHASVRGEHIAGAVPDQTPTPLRILSPVTMSLPGGVVLFVKWPSAFDSGPPHEQIARLPEQRQRVAPHTVVTKRHHGEGLSRPGMSLHEINVFKSGDAGRKPAGLRDAVVIDEGQPVASRDSDARIACRGRARWLRFEA